MAVLVKRKGTMTCEDCGYKVPAGSKSCPECGSTDIKKTVITVRKETTKMRIRKTAPVEEVDEVENDDLDPDDLEDVVDDEEVDGDETDDDEEDDEEVEEPKVKKRRVIRRKVVDEDEEAEDEEEEKPKVAKSLTPSASALVGLEIAAMASTLTTDLTTIFKSAKRNTRADAYEAAMSKFCGLMDSAVETWLDGSSVSKSGDDLETLYLVSIVKNTMDEIFEGVGGEETVAKSAGADIYKGLTPEAAEIVKKSAELIEETEISKWEGEAAKFENLGGVSKKDLGAALRTLADSDPKAYESLSKVLTSANTELKESTLLKSFGAPHQFSEDTPAGRLEAEAKEAVTKGTYNDIDVAKAELIKARPGDFYEPTNK